MKLENGIVYLNGQPIAGVLNIKTDTLGPEAVPVATEPIKAPLHVTMSGTLRLSEGEFTVIDNALDLTPALKP